VTRCTVDYGSGDYEEIEHATQMTLAVSALFRVLHDKASPRASAGAPYLQFQEGVGNGALGMARATAFVLDSTNRRLLRIGADLTLRGSVQILSHIDQATRQAEPIEGCRYTGALGIALVIMVDVFMGIRNPSLPAQGEPHRSF
jgi:hypothetical protein